MSLWGSIFLGMDWFDGSRIVFFEFMVIMRFIFMYLVVEIDAAAQIRVLKYRTTEEKVHSKVKATETSLISFPTIRGNISTNHW
jgi:hypothetical protein